MNLKQRILLGVNIDHIATVRQARGTNYPDPVKAVLDAEQAGADGITIHLREDRRHVQERDVRVIKAVMQTPMNFEMGITEEMMLMVEEVKPENVCLVPETREELTTEGGLDILSQEQRVSQAVQRLTKAGSVVSIFVDREPEQIKAAARVGAPTIELHTGRYSEAVSIAERQAELERIQQAVTLALNEGLVVNAGHGLNYHNVEAIAAIKGINELNIGHAIVAHALFVGFGAAVKEMKEIILAAAAR